MIDLNSITTVTKDAVDVLIEAANNYYNGRPTGITDLDYDNIYNAIKLEKPSFSIFDYVKYDSDSCHAVHPIEIPTFEKINFKDMPTEAINSSSIVLTPKYDGCSIVAYYNNGELFNILTRSDETTGVVQTNKLRNKVPQTVDKSIRAILFEAVTLDNRSAANGLINSKYKQDEVDSKLFLRPFDCVLVNRQLGYVERMELTGLDYTVLDSSDINDLQKATDSPKLYVGSIDAEVPIDGVVAYSRTNPSFGKIYKFYLTTEKSSVVTKMHFEQSKDTGIANIRVEYEPVKIGSITAKMSGNPGSWATVKEKKLGVGSKIKIALAKMTIPYITEHTEWTEEPIPICPWCGKEFSDFEGKLICDNEDCGFWIDFFETKYFNILREFKGSEWVDEFTVNGKFDIEMWAKAEKLTDIKMSDLITKPSYLMYILKPLQCGGATYDTKLKYFKDKLEFNKPANIFEMVDTFKSIFTSKQIHYIDTIWGILQHILRRLSRIRNKISL